MPISSHRVLLYANVRASILHLFWETKIFTDKKIRSLKTEKRQEDFYDVGFSGGSFQVRVTRAGTKSFVITYVAEGKRWRKTLGRYPRTPGTLAKGEMTLAQARKKARSLVGDVDEGRDPVQELRAREALPTLREYYENTFKPLYLENSGAFRASTRDHHLWAFGTHVLKSGLADMRLDRIRRQDVIALAGKLVGKGYSRATVEDVIRSLRRCLNEALEEGLIQVSPVRKISPTYKQAPVRKAEAQPLTRDQTLMFFEVVRAKSPLHFPLFFTAVQTGLRSGELKALKWEDLELEARALHVRHSYSHGQMNAPKTQRGLRTVDMSTALVAELRAHRQALREHWLKKGQPMPEWVFPNLAGNMLDLNNLKQRQFKAVLKAAGLPDIAFHSLRDTFASLLLMSGQPIAYVSAQLGHSNPKVTLDSYARWLPGTNRDAMEALPVL